MSIIDFNNNFSPDNTKTINEYETLIVNSEDIYFYSYLIFEREIRIAQIGGEKFAVLNKKR